MTDGLVSINGQNIETLQILFLTTILTLLPSLIVMMTSFTRYIISLSFIRTAMGTQQTPPNLVLIGMALVLTLFTMGPTFTKIQETAYEPYVKEQITQEEFVQRAEVPLKEFMIRNTKTDTLQMFCDLSKTQMPENVSVQSISKLPMLVIMPSFLTCELQRAFEIGFLLYLPFMLIDIVVSSTLMSMGMIMLPPAMISMPFKLLLFVSLHGWELLFSSLVQGFR